MQDDTKCPFACVASPSGEIIVERSLSSGNASEIAGRILQRLPRVHNEPGKRTYTMGGEGFAFRLAWRAGGHTFVVLEKGLGDQAAWRILGKMRQRWEAEFGGGSLVDIEVTTTAARPFATTLSEMLADPIAAAAPRGSASNEANDDLGAVNERLEQVRTVMHDSIEKVLERGERIDLLVDRADQLERNATTFAKSSSALKRQYRWRNLKSYLLMASAASLILYLYLASSCGGMTLPSCWPAPTQTTGDGFVPVRMVDHEVTR